MSLCLPSRKKPGQVTYRHCRWDCLSGGLDSGATVTWVCLYLSRTTGGGVAPKHRDTGNFPSLSEPCCVAPGGCHPCHALTRSAWLLFSELSGADVRAPLFTGPHFYPRNEQIEKIPCLGTQLVSTPILILAAGVPYIRPHLDWLQAAGICSGSGPGIIFGDLFRFMQHTLESCAHRNRRRSSHGVTTFWVPSMTILCVPAATIRHQTKKRLFPVPTVTGMFLLTAELTEQEMR